MDNNTESNNSPFKTVKVKKIKDYTKIKNIVIPFCSGVVGASLVMGVCFGIPQIKNNILKTNESKIVNTSAVTINPNQISLKEYSDIGIAVAQKVMPSIVGISVEYQVNSFFMNQSSTAKSTGSGIIISEDGYIITNNHVISTSTSSSQGFSFYSLGEASKITVCINGDKTEYEAKVIGTDELTDLAVIKIEKDGLTPVEIGSSSAMQVGEVVMAVGNPLGLDTSMTSGIISAVNREITDSDGKTYTLLQTDAAINSGNSGGALVNSKGELIGINNMKVAQTGVEGVGFAIPIDSAKPIYEELISNGSITRPYIGITGRDVSENVAKMNNIRVGIYVVEVEEFSAGEMAGIKAGDVIIKADGKEISTMNELNNIKNSHSVGDEMKIVVVRNGNEKELTVKLSKK